MSKLFARLKNFVLPVALCLASGLSPTHAAGFNGQSYMPIADWARANGLRCYWLKRGDEIVATNRTTRLVFDKDSRMAEFNGVNVALSFPVASDHGTLLIAQIDLNSAIRPLMYPSRFADLKRITTICLDPGHGGKDTGNHTFWHSEKTYTLALALELRDQLQKAGFNVILTRSKDTYVELPDRPALANRLGADLFVSLHFNATPTGKDDVEGPQTYCITPVGASSTDAQGEGANYGPTTANRVEQKSLLLAYQMQRSLVQNLRVPDRGVRRARFGVLRDATMPAILIEGGYMTHPVESKKIYNAAYRRQMAQAMVKGILAYQRLVSPPPPVVPATNRPMVNSNRVSTPKPARRENVITND
ncbi:MAG: N-acetylmuramoyl-L-alanine amidase [Verrucomicrobiota bacterium]